MKKNAIAIIPARGGSKRIPRKNIRSFMGKPIISYSIQAAIDSQLYDQVLVSTDDDEIASVANHYGAKTPFMRPAEISDDHATTDSVLLHAISWLEKNDLRYKYATCIYPTAPLIKGMYLAEALEILIKKNATSVFPVTTFAYNIFRSLKLVDNNRLELIWPENATKRSQDFITAYHDAGQFYWFDIEKYKKSGSLFSEDSYPIHLPRYVVQDIDSMEDWEMAERLFKVFNP